MFIQHILKPELQRSSHKETNSNIKIFYDITKFSHLVKMCPFRCLHLYCRFMCRSAHSGPRRNLKVFHFKVCSPWGDSQTHQKWESVWGCYTRGDRLVGLVSRTRLNMLDPGRKGWTRRHCGDFDENTRLSTTPGQFNTSVPRTQAVICVP